MKLAHSFEVGVVLYVCFTSCHRNMTALRVNQSVNTLSVDHEADSYTCSNCNVRKIVLYTFMSSIFELKFGQNVAICVKIYLEVRGHSISIETRKKTFQKRELLPCDFWCRSNGTIC